MVAVEPLGPAGRLGPVERLGPEGRLGPVERLGRSFAKAVSAMMARNAIWGNCYAGDCSVVEEGAACAAPAGWGSFPGLCSGDNCLPECEVLEHGSACHQEDGVGVCTDSYCAARCDNNEDCSDYKDCTSDTCLGNGLCESVAVEDGTSCAGGTCQSGACVLESSVLPCTEQGIRNAAAGNGSYTFDCSGPRVVLTDAEIVFDKSVILDGGGNLTVDGNQAHGVFLVNDNATVVLRRLVVTGGGGGRRGITNEGRLSLTNSTVSGNSEGGIYVAYESTLTITNSTVSENSSEICGIDNDGTILVINSTISGNDADESCELILHNQASFTLTRTIVSSSSGRAACGGDSRVISNGYNIESPGDTCGFDHGTDLVNITEGQLDLEPLADNGGPIMTHALGADSVAIDHIPAVACELPIDQRGQPRPETGGTMCDVGSFEVQP